MQELGDTRISPWKHEYRLSPKKVGMAGVFFVRPIFARSCIRRFLLRQFSKMFCAL